MSSAKPALKRQRAIQQAPAKLVFQKPFEFFTSLPMQECIVRLKFATKEEVYLNRVSPTKVEFHVLEQGRKIGPAWAVGCIEELDEAHTRIFGKTGVPRDEVILTIGGMALVGIILILSNLSNFWVMCLAAILVAPLIIPLSFASYEFGRDNLIEKLQSITTENSIQ